MIQRAFLYSITAGMALTVIGCAGTGPVRSAEKQKSQIAAEQVLPKVDLTPEILYDILLGEIAGRRGQFDVSIRALIRAAHTTRDPRLAERATLAAIYAKSYADALDMAKLWVALRPHYIDAREALATVLLSMNKPAEAELHFEKMLDLAAQDPHLGKIYMRIAGVLSRQKNRKAMLEIMQTLTRHHASNSQAQFALAHLAMRAMDFSQGTAAIDRALIFNPGWEDAALLKIRMLVSANTGEKVNQFYKTFLKRYPDATQFRMNFARYLVDKQQWEAARKEFIIVLKKRPYDKNVYYALGLLSLQTDHLQDADTYFRRAIEISPNNEQFRLYLGQTADRQKNYKEAVKWYKSVTGKAFYFEARTRLGVVAARMGDVDRGRKILHQTKPENDQQRAQLALAEEQILREAKRYTEALKVLNRALNSLPKHKDLLYARALVAEKLDNLKLHEQDLRQVLQQDPKNAHAMNALGYTLADRTDRHKEAFELIRQALDLRPNDPFILDSMGWVQYRMGHHSDAIQYLRRALKIRSDGEISAHLGEVLWVSGKRRQASRVWDDALKRSPENPTILNTIKKFKK